MVNRRFLLIQGEAGKPGAIDDCKTSGRNSAYTQNKKLVLQDLDAYIALCFCWQFRQGWCLSFCFSGDEKKRWVVSFCYHGSATKPRRQLSCQVWKDEEGVSKDVKFMSRKWEGSRRKTSLGREERKRLKKEFGRLGYHQVRKKQGEERGNFDMCIP